MGVSRCAVINTLRGQQYFFVIEIDSLITFTSDYITSCDRALACT